jgi:lipopolysaccharide/colanic/teichoic acid biosynthesis glycosyltransferase
VCPPGSDRDAIAAPARLPAAAADEGVVRLTYRFLDVTIALTSLILTAPLFIAVCVAIRLDSNGPTIFRQRRLGYGKRPFIVYKFRTMCADADRKSVV